MRVVSCVPRFPQDRCCDREACDEHGNEMLHADDCATIDMVVQSLKPADRMEEKLCSRQRSTRKWFAHVACSFGKT